MFTTETPECVPELMIQVKVYSYQGLQYESFTEQLNVVKCPDTAQGTQASLSNSMWLNVPTLHTVLRLH